MKNVSAAGQNRQSVSRVDDSEPGDGRREAQDRLLMDTLICRKRLFEKRKQLKLMLSGRSPKTPRPVEDVSLDARASQQKWGGVD